MSNQILVPSLGESIKEATVSKWLKQVGEEVDSDEPLVELETDKVNVEVPSPLSGTLTSIEVKEGDTVEVGGLLGMVSEGQKSVAADQNKKKSLRKKLSEYNLRKFIYFLKKIGYRINFSNANELKKLIKVFQMRFRPNLVDGKPDLECYKIAKSLCNLK